MVNIYILKCAQNKYYVGKTNQPEVRINQHFAGDGSAWTKKYPPLEVERLIENCDEFDEDKWTLKYMSEKGINNVRGGSFCQMRLTPENKQTINQMIKGSSDKCYICGSSQHFANYCTYDEDDLKDFMVIEVSNRCYRCHRPGHFERECYAKTYMDGSLINDSCQRCGRKSHNEDRCHATTYIDGSPIDDGSRRRNKHTHREEKKLAHTSSRKDYQGNLPDEKPSCITM